MGEIDDVQHAIDQRQPKRDQRVKRAGQQPVQRRLQEMGKENIRAFPVAARAPAVQRQGGSARPHMSKSKGAIPARGRICPAPAARRSRGAAALARAGKIGLASEKASGRSP